MNIEIAAEMLDALGNPIRLKIVHILSKAGDEGMAVGSLLSAIGGPGSTLTHHVAKLVRAGLVRQVRHGKMLKCHVEGSALTELSSYLAADRERLST